MIILAFILPPISVYVTTHDPKKTVLNVVLTILGWIPGVVHAAIVVTNARKEKQLIDA